MKKTIRLPITLLLLIFLLNTSLFSQKKNHVQGEILIKLNESINVDNWIASHQHYRGKTTNLKLRKKISNPMNIYAFTFDYNKVDENEMLEYVRNDRAVEVAQFNHYVKSRSTIPNDPQFNQQWQYVNTGQSGGTSGADIDADLAWDVTTGGLTPQGDTIVVCIIDGGFEITHPDLAPNVWYNYAEIPSNGIDDDNNGFIDDFRGWNTGQNNDDVTQGDDPSHGTAVAGIVGAKGNNGTGVAGVNWDVKLMLISGGTGVESEVLEAYSYPLTARKKYNETNGQQGAFVVATNASWGIDGGQASSAPLWCAFYDSLGVHGILNAGATVNADSNVDVDGDLPTTCPSDYLIGVTNMDHNDQKVTQAGYGTTHVDIGAFGEGTWTAAIGNSYDGFGGTSGATPHVAGTIALLYSAPCSNFIALAKANPSAAALQIRQHILNGGDDNTSLQGITVTGKRLNVNNSMQLLMNNCGPCPAPSGLGTENLTDVQAILTWTSTGSATSDTLRWREVGTTNWTVVSGATSPVTLSNLLACTDYEFQVKSNCDAIASDYSSLHAFKTDGCCENPTNLTISDISNNASTASWGGILAAQSYNVRIRPIGTTDWTTSNTSDTMFDFSGLVECTEYEVQIQSLCVNQQVDYSSSITFQTMGCGACIDLSYCNAPTLNSSEEWIESVVLNTINNTSGNNNGYGDFTGENSTDLATNNTYDLTLTPGYSGQAYNENIRVWIDFNGDGDFGDSGEEVVNTSNVTAATTSMITIPGNATIGQTRMRVAMSFEPPTDACTAPSSDAFGEIEDYCVNIGIGTIPCNIPTGLDSTMVAENSVDLTWANTTGSTNYIIRYKKATVSTWVEMASINNSITISNLEDCTNYEAQIKAVCSNSESDFSSSFNFTTDCATTTHDLSKELSSLIISPNPFSQNIEINFSFYSTKELVTVELINHLGKIFQSETLKNVSQGNQQIIFDGSHLAAGLYLVRFKTSTGKSFSKKIIKTNR